MPRESKLQIWLNRIPLKLEELHIGFWVKVATLPIIFCTLSLCLTLDTPVTSELQKTILYITLCVYFLILAISLILGVLGVYKKSSDTVFAVIAILGALLFTVVFMYTFLNLVIYAPVFAAGAPLVTAACLLVSVILSVSVFLPKSTPRLVGEEEPGEVELTSFSKVEERSKPTEKSPKAKDEKPKSKEEKPKGKEGKTKVKEEKPKGKEKGKGGSIVTSESAIPIVDLESEPVKASTTQTPKGTSESSKSPAEPPRQSKPIVKS